MRGFLLDTCAISEFIKDSPNLGLVTWLARIEPNTVYLSSVTIGELRYGIALQKHAKKREKLERWLRSEVLADFEDRILGFDSDVAERWGWLRAKARSAGKPIPVIDAIISAIALHYNVAVVSRNEADFCQAGITVINPWSDR